jgi:hypothetical protein
VLIWRRRGRRCLYLGLLGSLHPSIAWSTALLQASCMVTLCLSSGATIHLSRRPHALQSTRSPLLHFELRSLLEYVSRASTSGGGGDWELHSRVSPAQIGLHS